MEKYEHFAVIGGNRIQKAKKTIACLEFVMKDDLKNKKILEIGSGSGLISYEISREGNEVTCIDIQFKPLKAAINKSGFHLENCLNLLIADGAKLPFKSDYFDIVICNQVIEHVPKRIHQQLIDESYRVLQLKGLFYIATGNRLWPTEPHKKLLFYHTFPKNWLINTSNYLKELMNMMFFLPTYNQLREIVLTKFITLIDLTPIIEKNPEMYYIRNEIPNLLKSILKLVPLGILREFTSFYSSWILVWVKK
jgi:ubiquinone/menaquinone biosynthesis C-methylase UbiE